MTSEIKVGLLGHGYWGRNLARNIAGHPQLELAWVADPGENQLQSAQRQFPHIKCISDPTAAVTTQDADVVVVATPVATHFQMASLALDAGRHVVVTKPLASTSAEAEKLAEIADAKDRVLLVDNTFVYTGAVRRLAKIVTEGDLGDLIYCQSTRVNLGTYRRDSSVIWDLAPHDLSILDSIGYGSPVAVSATAGGRMGGPMDQVAHISLHFADGFLAHINVSWLAPVKMRLMLFGGTQKMLVYDDVEPSEKVKVYDKGVDISPVAGQPQVEYRLGDMWAPQLDQTEALFAELDHLVSCVRGEAKAITGPDSGVNAIRVLEAATRSAENAGQIVVLDPDRWHGHTPAE